MRLKLCLPALALFFAAEPAPPQMAAANGVSDSPNIILILTDDQGWSQTGYPADPRMPASGSDYLETPNLARIAKSGMRFSSGYSPAPLCTPTRRSILCGAATARCGSEFKSDWVPSEHLTIPAALRHVDPRYRCAHFGKWGEQMISTPEECGYDHSDGMTGNNTGGMPASLGYRGHAQAPAHFVDNEDPKRTSSVTDRSVDFIRSSSGSGQPFYLQISYYAQHLSVVCREQSLAKYQSKGTPDRAYPPAWAAMLDDLDHGIGRVLDCVQELGIEDETYIFFTADNGGRDTVPGGDESRLPPNFPLRGAKHSLYEGGIRVPFAVSGPGIPAGSVCHTPVVGYDLLATFYELAGGANPDDQLGPEVDGSSICPLLRDPSLQSLERKNGAIFFHRPARGVSVVRSGASKALIFWRPDGTVDRREFYDLAVNPTEDGNATVPPDEGSFEVIEASLLDFLEAVDAERPQDFGGQKKKARNDGKRLSLASPQ